MSALNMEGVFLWTYKTLTIVPIANEFNISRGGENKPINVVPTYEKLLKITVNKQIITHVANQLSNINQDSETGTHV